MTIMEILESYGREVAAGLGVVLLLLLWAAVRLRRGSRPTASGGPGAAMALALTGDLVGARQMLERLVRESADRADALIGLVAVLRASGELDRAAAIVERLAAGSEFTWIRALQVRLALDVGELDRAADIVSAHPSLPMSIQLAAMVRAGRWEDALARYQQGTPRRSRDRAVLAALLSGCAAQYTREGAIRGARRALKRALALDPEGLLPLAVAARIAEREAAREDFGRRAAERAPWLALSDPETFPISKADADPERAVLAEARERFDAGEIESALGNLRDHLDRHPDAWIVRNQYDRWLIEKGEPADWRAELAEVLERIPTSEREKSYPVACRACGFLAIMPFYICPRCDGLGTAGTAAAESASGPRGGPSRKGSEIAELLDISGASGHVTLG